MIFYILDRTYIENIIVLNTNASQSRRILLSFSSLLGELLYSSHNNSCVCPQESPTTESLQVMSTGRLATGGGGGSDMVRLNAGKGSSSERVKKNIAQVIG